MSSYKKICFHIYKQFYTINSFSIITIWNMNYNFSLCQNYTLSTCYIVQIKYSKMHLRVFSTVKIICPAQLCYGNSTIYNYDNRGAIAPLSHAWERYHSSRGAARKILALQGAPRKKPLRTCGATACAYVYVIFAPPTGCQSTKLTPVSTIISPLLLLALQYIMRCRAAVVAAARIDLSLGIRVCMRVNARH